MDEFQKNFGKFLREKGEKLFLRKKFFRGGPPRGSPLGRPWTKKRERQTFVMFQTSFSGRVSDHF